MSLQPGQDHEGAQGNAQRAFSLPSGGVSSHIQSAKVLQSSPQGETWLRLKKKLVLSRPFSRPGCLQASSGHLQSRQLVTCSGH